MVADGNPMREEVVKNIATWLDSLRSTYHKNRAFEVSLVRLLVKNNLLLIEILASVKAGDMSVLGNESEELQ